MAGEAFIKELIEKAKSEIKTILLPETDDERIIKAAIELAQKKYTKVILIGDENKIKEEFKKLNYEHDNFISIFDHLNSKEFDRFVNEYYELRKHKGLTLEKAKEAMKDNTHFATMLLYDGIGDGLVSGADSPSAHTFRTALQIIKTKPGIKTASSFFFMIFPDKILVYADCGFNIQPTSEQLAEIAIVTNDNAKSFGIEPKVALLSFSTKGSAKHPDVDKVKNALTIVKKLRPDIIIDGELQFDAAIIPKIAEKKCPDSPVGGNANVLIFPDLDSGNIGYKITERLGGALALGPISEGFNKPVNDLSRGCSVEDIVHVACITAIQAGMK